MGLDHVARSAIRRMLVLAVTLPALASPCAAELAFVSLGTGATGGGYYPIGREICELVNRGHAEHGVRCSVEATVGSVYNVDHLRTQELDLAIVQADVQHDAFTGVGRWSGRPLLGLRSILALYPEMLTIVTRSDAGVASVADLAGKRVNIGSRGTGSRAAWDVLEQGLGWKRDVLGAAMELRPAAADAALCTGELDASVQVLGHPSPRVAQLLDECATTLVPVAGPAVDALTAARPYLQPSSIQGALYGRPGETPTFGGRAVLLATERTPDRVVEAVTLAIIDHLAELQAKFPVLRQLEIKAMLADAQKNAPPHPGVALAVQQRGLTQ